MEPIKKIKLHFENEEKILTSIPKTFEEFKQQFHNLFSQSNPELNYSFEYNLNERAFINEANYEDGISEIKKMDNPIIYVEIMKTFVNNSNIDSLIKNIDNSISKDLAQSQENNALNEQNNFNSGEIIEKLSDELRITDEKLRAEINTTIKLKKIIKNKN